MFMFISLILFASLGCLNAAACPTRQVERCAIPFTQVNPSDISQICRLRNDLQTCLQPFAADCTGDSTFISLSQSIQGMAGMCPSSNEINQGNVCPITVVAGCARTYTEGTGSLGGPSGGNIARLCSLSSDLRNCLQPYDAACVGNNMYEMLKQSLESSENFCPPANLIPGEPNGRHDESHPEMIINSTEIVEDQGMVMNSTDTAHDECIDEVIKCSSGIDQSAYVPPGSLSKGFYVSKYFLYRYCSTGKNVSKCVQDSKILEEPKCSYIADPMKQQFAIWKAVCTGRGYKDLQTLRPCINNHKLQLNVYGFGERVSGFLKGMRECESNSTTTICRRIPGAARTLFDMVDEACGSNMIVVFKRLVKNAAIATMGKLTELCPDLSSWINQI